MKRVINLDIHAVSINNAYYSDKRFGYKAEVREWISQVCYQLSQSANKRAMADLRNTFDEKKHSFTVLIKYYTPNFYNKQGTISAKSMDVGNIDKVLLDVVFTGSFYGTGNMECENINHDDRFISSLMVNKYPSEKHKLVITVKIKKLPVL